MYEKQTTKNNNFPFCFPQKSTSLRAPNNGFMSFFEVFYIPLRHMLKHPLLLPLPFIFLYFTLCSSRVKCLSHTHFGVDSDSLVLLHKHLCSTFYFYFQFPFVFGLVYCCWQCPISFPLFTFLRTALSNFSLNFSLSATSCGAVTTVTKTRMSSSSSAAASTAKLLGTVRANYLREMQTILRSAYVGKPVSCIPSPSLVIHADAADRNKKVVEALVMRYRGSRAAAQAEGGAEGGSLHALRLRPHAKLHKSRALAERILAAPEGSAATDLYAGVCVQKVSEAEALSGYFDDGASPGGAPFAIRDIYISNEVGSLAAASRVAALHAWMCAENAKEGAASRRLSICVDSAASVTLILAALNAVFPEGVAASPLALFIEVNVGQNRGGAKVSEEALAPIVDAIVGGGFSPSPLVRLEGLHAYHGGAQHIRDPSERAAVMAVTMGLTNTAKALIEGRLAYHHAKGASAAGPTRLATVTGAGTGTFAVAEGPNAALSAYNELQPGSYYAMDRDYLANRAMPPAEGGGTDGSRGLFEPAMYIKATVVSKTVVGGEGATSSAAGGPSRVVVDSGHKSSAIDSGLPCMAPWQLNQILSSSSSSPVASSWTSEYLVECSNGGDDHGTFAAAPTLNFVRIGGSATAPHIAPEPIATAEGRSAVGDAIVAGLSLGDSVWLIPGHCDPTFNLHDYFFIVRGDSVGEGIIEEVGMVDARGCQQ